MDNNSCNVDIHEIFKCTSCDIYMSDIIYICAKSEHNFCQGCWLILNACPICGDDFGAKRNTTLQKMSQLLMLTCPHPGCEETLYVSDLNVHKDVLCNFRRYRCRIDEQCQWNGLMCDLKKHNVQQHPNLVFFNDEIKLVWTVNKSDNETHYIIAHNYEFFLYRFRVSDVNNDKVCWALQYMGPPEYIDKFYYDFEIVSEEHTRRKMSFSEICYGSNYNDLDEVFESGFYISIANNVLRSYLNCDGHVICNLKIVKI